MELHAAANRLERFPELPVSLDSDSSLQVSDEELLSSILSDDQQQKRMKRNRRYLRPRQESGAPKPEELQRRPSVEPRGSPWEQPLVVHVKRGLRPLTPETSDNEGGEQEACVLLSSSEDQLHSAHRMQFRRLHEVWVVDRHDADTNDVPLERSGVFVISSHPFVGYMCSMELR